MFRSELLFSQNDRDISCCIRCTALVRAGLCRVSLDITSQNTEVAIIEISTPLQVKIYKIKDADAIRQSVAIFQFSLTVISIPTYMNSQMFRIALTSQAYLVNLLFHSHFYLSLNTETLAALLSFSHMFRII